MRTWKNKVVVITGATAGVGRATVREFARRGANIGLLAREPARLDWTCREVEELGGHALAIPTDIADPGQVESAAACIEHDLGPIDVWINNAMTAVFGEFQDVEPDEYRRVTDVVYHGTVWGTLAALRRMLPRNRGRIVLVGSALAWRGIPLQSAYCGAKHAVLGMFESLRSELLHRKTDVTISIVHLPAVNTPQFSWVRSKIRYRSKPVAPIFQPELPARAIEYAARTGRRTIHVTFATSKAIFASRVAPAVVDHYLARVGYDEQMTDELEDPSRSDNLFHPVAGDFAAHGRFDRWARRRSPSLWIGMHRRKVLLLAAVVVGAVGLAMLRRAPR